MDILEDDELENEANIKNKKKLILILIAVCVFLLLALVAAIVFMPKKTEVIQKKNYLDGQEIKNENLIFKAEDGTEYISLKDLSDALKYTYCNGAYLEYSEDKTKCYIETENNVVGFQVNSNEIYKVKKDLEKGYEYFTLQNEAVTMNDKIYIALTDARKALNVIVKNQTNKMTIDTPDYFIEQTKEDIEAAGYTAIDTSEDNLRLLSYDMIVVEKGDKKGIINTNLEEVIGIKYDTIVFDEGRKELIVSNNKKYGIISIDGNIRLKLMYDNLEILNYDPLLYVIGINEKFGVLNAKKETIVEPEYDKISSTLIRNIDKDLGPVIIVQKDEKYGLIDSKDGEAILDCIFDKIEETEEGDKQIYILENEGQKYMLENYVKEILKQREEERKEKEKEVVVLPSQQ